jgi:hypothetical protein
MGIVGTAWPSFAFKPRSDESNKERSTLLIEMVTPEMADRLVKEGMVKDCRMLVCQR